MIDFPHLRAAATPTRAIPGRPLGAVLAAIALLAGSPGAGADNPPSKKSHATFVGTARVIDGAVQLDPAVGGADGAVWRNRPISLLQSFEARWQFTLTAGTFPQADGVALVIQTDGVDAIGLSGGGIGYEGLHGVASVVQTYVNNHVGLNLDSNPYNAKNSPADLGSAQQIEGSEIVTYDAVAHTLSMKGQLTVDGIVYRVHDHKDVDLAALLGSDSATIGVTGGTGADTADQRAIAWKFRPLP